MKKKKIETADDRFDAQLLSVLAKCPRGLHIETLALMTRDPDRLIASLDRLEAKIDYLGDENEIVIRLKKKRGRRKK